MGFDTIFQQSLLSFNSFLCLFVVLSKSYEKFSLIAVFISFLYLKKNLVAGCFLGKVFQDFEKKYVDMFFNFEFSCCFVFRMLPYLIVQWSNMILLGFKRKRNWIYLII